MKVFFVLPIRGPINGVKVISSYLLSAFKKDYDTQLIDTAQATGYADFGKFKLQKILSIFDILKEFKNIKSDDVVYLNFSTKGFSFYRDFVLLKAIRLRTQRVCIHIHANGLEHKLKRPFLNTFKKVKVIVINPYQKEALKQLPNVELIENALPDYYQNKNFQKPKNATVQLVFISNLSKEKGALRLKQTCEWIEKNNLAVELRIAGGILDDYSQSIIDEIEQLSFVQYLGPIHDLDEKMNLLLSSDILLMLSDKNYEVYPLVYIEALMNGCGIMTTVQIISSKFTNEEFGFEWSEKALKTMVATLVNDKKDNLIGQQARTFYLKNYTFRDYYHQIKNYIVE